MQWVSASMPVAAVNSGGRPSVSSGSQMARAGIRWPLISASLRPSRRVIRAPRPTSLPVPAVVGTAINGTTGPMRPAPPSISAYSASCPAWVARRATALARSMAEPPPSATSPSQAPCRKASKAASTAASVGLPGVSVNSACSAGSMRRTRSSSGSRAMPGSVTSSGLRMPSSASSCGSSSTAPAPKRVVVR